MAARIIPGEYRFGNVCGARAVTLAADRVCPGNLFPVLAQRRRTLGGTAWEIQPDRLVVLLSSRVRAQDNASFSFARPGLAWLGNLPVGPEQRRPISVAARAVRGLYALRFVQPHRHRRALLPSRFSISLYPGRCVAGQNVGVAPRASRGCAGGDYARRLDRD